MPKLDYFAASWDRGERWKGERPSLHAEADRWAKRASKCVVLICAALEQQRTQSAPAEGE